MGNTYKTLGKEGLKRNTKDTNYLVQFKRNVIKYMLRTAESYQTTANYFMIHNPAMLCDWKKKYETGGVEALSKTKGRPAMEKGS